MLPLSSVLLLLLHIVVLCYVVWCGVVWCGVVWCGVVWCGVVWCGVVWCGVVWCGVVWCGVVGMEVQLWALTKAHLLFSFITPTPTLPTAVLWTNLPTK